MRDTLKRKFHFRLWFDCLDLRVEDPKGGRALPSSIEDWLPPKT